MLRKIWAPIAAAGALLVKFGAVIFKLKIFTVAGSMFVSVGAYALLGGWWFGVGLVAADLRARDGPRARGCAGRDARRRRRSSSRSSARSIGMKRMPQNAWQEAQNALAGPILGTAGAAVVWAARRRATTRDFAQGAGVRRLLDQPLQPPAVRAARRRARRRRDPPRARGARPRGPRRAGGLPPEPDPDPDPDRRRHRAWRRWQTRHHPEFQAYYRVLPWQRATVLPRLRRLWRRSSCSGCTQTHVPRASERGRPRAPRRAQADDIEREVARIAEEFRAGFEHVDRIDRPAVALFGSARIGEEHPAYAAARETGRLFAERGLGGRHRRRRRRDGGGEPRRAGGRRPLGRLQHRAAARAGRRTSTSTSSTRSTTSTRARSAS